MTTPKTWTPPPEMPSDLPPLPVGRNGKPLVYVGVGPLEPLSEQFEHYTDHPGKWQDGCSGCNEYHYAAESDSEICRLNQWGDFTPPAKPQTVLDVYRADVSAKLADAAKTVQELRQSLAEWENYHGQLMQAHFQLEEGDALSRKAWLEEGMKIQRLHMKKPTVFPKYP